MIVKLIVRGGKNEGAVITVNKPQFVIGRLPECNLRIESKALSRRHAQIDVKDGAVTVKDLGSTNGTFVDGQKITEEVELKNGQILRIGPLETQVQISAEINKNDIKEHHYGIQRGLTTVVDWNSFQEKAEQKKSENVNKAADSREAAEKTLEAMFKSSLK